MYLNVVIHSFKFFPSSSIRDWELMGEHSFSKSVSPKTHIYDASNDE